MPDLSKLFTRRWYCQVFYSGQHNGVYCTEDDPHFDCGYRWTAPPLTDQYAKKYGLKISLDVRAGDQIRYKMGRGPTRLGGAEPKHVVAVTEEWIVYKTYSARGEDLGEKTLTHTDYRKNWEKGEADALTVED